ncbi:SGNH/GDSL hydrolase family protein [Pseudonocardia sp. KRD291]|uniref:SGNH/GDSL hydrolase family protein n=1 Tax=Pseudonocardia sp. KRD291 TaxID=2792007 RepID=UPI001C4A343F|nr:SGNH/GDSL hydrolase family protein [Pseudonocardia sp. KRD291]MBW0103227.1 SGNH/GDSL hydrolase family protein [Pseudonocardia sp. KRD291]
MLRFLLPVLACALLLVGLAPVASAAERDTAVGAAAGAPVDYVALGDSYAAGVGAAPDGSSGDCRRSERSYPARFAAATDPATFVSVACSGATAGQVLLRQVRTVSRQTDLVTITVGGNDTGFAPVMGLCSTVRKDEDCERAVRGGERAARYLVPVGLTAIIAAAKVQSPTARIVVLGYPRLFAPGEACDVALVPNAARRASLNRAADTLNASLRATATRFGARFADVSGAFAEHGVCSADPWINGPSAPQATGNYHPTRVGYARGYLPALRSAAPRT